MLEFDGQALDPAIVSAQPMKPGQTVDLQQMGCPASERRSVFHCSSKIPPNLLSVVKLFSHLVMHFIVHLFLKVSLSESRLPQTSVVSGQESTQVSKIRKLTVKLDFLDLLRRVYCPRNKNQPWGK